MRAAPRGGAAAGGRQLAARHEATRNTPKATLLRPFPQPVQRAMGADGGGGSSAFARFVGSSAAALVAETATLPTDVAKTRLQTDTSGKYGGSLVKCWRSTVAEEGLGALWKGLQPALIRQVCYSSLAMVLFEPIRDLMVRKGEEPNFAQRLLAGGTAGSLAISVFNPTEVIKVCRQNDWFGPQRRRRSY